MSEESRQAASQQMSMEWAKGLGDCGTCQNASQGGSQ